MPEDQVKIKKQSEMSDGMVCCSSGEHYPYDTGLSFDNEMLDELGVEGLAVGDVVEVRGYAFVDSKSEHSSKEHSSKSMRLQMTSIKVRREVDDRVKQMYGDGS
jgi:hypothetical protein